MARWIYPGDPDYPPDLIQTDWDDNEFVSICVRVPIAYMHIVNRMFPLKIEGMRLKRRAWLGRAIQGALLVADLLNQPPEGE